MADWGYLPGYFKRLDSGLDMMRDYPMVHEMSLMRGAPFLGYLILYWLALPQVLDSDSKHHLAAFTTY